MEKLTPYNLVPGEVYFMEGSNGTKWYITNFSDKGSQEKTGFSISANGGYNSSHCYHQSNCQFYHGDTEHAYTNMADPKFRHLTEEEMKWFTYCKIKHTFITFDSFTKNYDTTPIQPILRDFPVKGVCWKPTKTLLKYLQKTRDSGYTINLNERSVKGLAWSASAIWPVSASSGNPEYKIEQLKQFLIPENLALRPLTPDECYIDQDKVFYDKWCLSVTLYNFDDLTLFMRKHKKEWRDYRDEWVLNVGSIFHYPPYVPCAHSSDMIEPGYTMISTNQFLTHVLTHTDKQQIYEPQKQQENGKHKEESGSCKIQRPHLTVGDSDPIRATGIRCPKVKIQVRSGHLPD